MSESFHSAESSAEQLRHKASDLKEDIVDMAKLSKEYATEKLRGLREGAVEKAHGLREGASRTWTRGRAKADDVQKSIEDFVVDQPLKSLLIAVGAGLLLGFFWRRS
jgi:ElaB/YqjD/DUF883 family membrane-anchored ribosome-binding protein